MSDPPAAAIRVLYAEDNPADVDLTATHFAAAAPQFQIEIVRTGEECLARLRDGGHDILLLDNHLPDMDGIDVLRQLAELQAGVPVVLTTSVGDESVAVQALRLGAADYVAKDGDYLSRLPGVLERVLADPAAPRPGAAEGRSRSVLYVERDSADADLTTTHLAEVAPHLRVEIATTSAAALERLEAGGIDVVLADLRLSGMNALELLTELRRRGLDVPFMIVTGGGDERTAVEALKLGAYDYIVKRGDYLAHLPYALDHAITQHRLARANRELQRELSERRQLQQAMVQTVALLEGLQQHAPVGIAFLDCDGCFQRVNDEQAAMTGVPIAAHTGRTIGDLVPRLAPSLEPLCRLAREGQTTTGLEVTATTADGAVRSYSVSVYPVHGTAQEVVGVGLVMADITDRKQAETALRDHASMMADVARQKDEFLAMLSHELRNPLAPIRTALELLRRDATASDLARGAHEVIGRQVGHMVRLLDDLLDVARITRGRVALTKHTVDVRRIAADAIESVGPLIASRRQTLESSMPAEPLLVQADLTRLVQVLVNLLNNAAKYSDEGTTIRLSVTSEDGLAVVRVADAGAGIPPRLLPKIFDLFTQDERSLDRSQGGLGIGLTLVKQITELHGGSVEAHSEGRGLGSTFTVRLPLHDSERPPLHPSARPDRTTPLRCLVVEDNADAARMLEVALTMEGHEVMLAADGVAAVETAAAFQPDVIVLDIGLPRMSGYEAAAAIRQLPGLADVVIIGLTGYGQAADYEQSRRAGFDAHLVKPVEIDTLLDALAAGRRRPP
jgi:PAS domain S-box-containing protein